MAGTERSAFLKGFGKQLKLLRERAGLTQAELASRVGYSTEQVASVECGRRIPKPELIDKADEVLEAGGLLKAMKEEAVLARYPAFFRDAARLEAEAVEVQIYAHQAVPGLLQTEEYARAVFGMRRPLLDEEVVAQRVAARMARQEIFSVRPAPLLGFVIEESVLRKPFGGRQVLRGQLEQLLLIGEKRNVEIQVMPLSREDNAGVDGPLTLMTPKGGEQLAYVECQGQSTLLTDRDEVHAMAARYGIIRAQALTPRESATFIEKLLGEL
ncbi:helix-turn-helix domain-containing protein [Streptomyces sp. NEAU-Y11]|uniref:helix-turn-helix domain-containing protein n=1 Tax=Streptomyces cucumeris TaxID=2962890 RepID=UPI0020C8B846|nr:helix-turn-helix transcriptional regulator [Streptomyces sp. NEAU-Y11]MCP9208240.1 helix-turn-helix transcriptional regulator [Streptomyces sp. NEAU-Y11]